ncbi:restriction endonuclease subunit S, partial [Alphaproteobacteria bacterium]|nr:restriction endonuclease subunit S [Alphaproteobacteria bacterium]
MSEQVPEGWEENTLETLVSVDSDSLKGDIEPDYRFKYIDISCVSTGKVTPPTENIAFKDAPSRAKRVVKRGDVLVATVRPNLKAFAHFDEAGDGWVASTGFAVLRHKKNSDSRFIYNIMLSDDVSRQIGRLVAGSNYPAINSSDVKELTLLIPPLPEQKKIASILTSVDEVIEKTQSQIDKLQDLKKATMNELLTKGIGHTEFKDSELGRIPKSWEVRKVSDLVSQSKKKGRDNLPIYSVLIEGGMVDRSTQDRRIPSELEDTSNLYVRKGNLA